MAGGVSVGNTRVVHRARPRVAPAPALVLGPLCQPARHAGPSFHLPVAGLKLAGGGRWRGPHIAAGTAGQPTGPAR